MSRETCIIIGNSHMVSFEGALRERINGHSLADQLRLHFVPWYWMKYGMFDVRSNLMYRKIEFGKVANRPPLPTIFVNPRERLHVVYVGVRMMGDGLLRAHGELYGGVQAFTPGIRHTPPVPWVAGPGAPGLDAEVVSQRCLASIYASYFRPLLSIIGSISRSRSLASVSLVLSPDPVVQTGRFRLGDAFVDAGQWKAHRQAASLSFCGLAGDALTVIGHPDFLVEERSGFTPDRFAWRPHDPSDIHVNDAYFHPAADLLLRRLSGVGVATGLPP